TRQREGRENDNGKSSADNKSSHDFLHSDDGSGIACYLDGMTLRPPQASSSSRIAALDYEIAQEQVAALGRMGRALEAALAALAEHDRSHGTKDAAPARPAPAPHA